VPAVRSVATIAFMGIVSSVICWFEILQAWTGLRAPATAVIGSAPSATNRYQFTGKTDNFET
ncbi:hypothetical protein, partial [Mesorhizobium sp.]|uniref:hypothetical protein n=1 Tax=Mesorhizobium sp. TaxID=1871066 RepID=UPI0025D29E7B